MKIFSCLANLKNESLYVLSPEVKINFMVLNINCVSRKEADDYNSDVIADVPVVKFLALFGIETPPSYLFQEVYLGHLLKYFNFFSLITLCLLLINGAESTDMLKVLVFWFSSRYLINRFDGIKYEIYGQKYYIGDKLIDRGSKFKKPRNLIIVDCDYLNHAYQTIDSKTLRPGVYQESSFEKFCYRSF